MYCLLLVVSTLVFVCLLPFHVELAVLAGGIDFYSMWKVAGGK